MSKILKWAMSAAWRDGYYSAEKDIVRAGHASKAIALLGYVKEIELKHHRKLPGSLWNEAEKGSEGK